MKLQFGRKDFGPKERMGTTSQKRWQPHLVLSFNHWSWSFLHGFGIKTYCRASQTKTINKKKLSRPTVPNRWKTKGKSEWYQNGQNITAMVLTGEIFVSYNAHLSTFLYSNTIERSSLVGYAPVILTHNLHVFFTPPKQQWVSDVRGHGQCHRLYIAARDSS